MTGGARVRPGRAEDLAAVRALAVAAGLFGPDDVAEVVERTDVAHGEPALWLMTTDDDGVVVGTAYSVREPVSDGVWNMLMLAVDPEHHRGGLGRELVAAVEAALRGLEEPATALVVETSSTEDFARARAFYAAVGYTEVGRVPHYYGRGDDKVVLWKTLLRAEG